MKILNKKANVLRMILESLSRRMFESILTNHWIGGRFYRVKLYDLGDIITTTKLCACVYTYMSNNKCWLRISTNNLEALFISLRVQSCYEESYGI